MLHNLQPSKITLVEFSTKANNVSPPSRQFEEFEDPCDSDDFLVFNALDYYQGFFGWSNAYDHNQKKQKICKVVDKVERVIKMLKRFKKSKRSKRKYWRRKEEDVLKISEEDLNPSSNLLS